MLGFDNRTWIVFLASALVSQVIGYMALAYALGHLPASIVAPTMVLQPVVTALLAIPLLGETPNTWQGDKHYEIATFPRKDCFGLHMCPCL